MADNSGIIKIGLFGAAVYVAYTQGWLSFLGLDTSTKAAATTSTSSTGTTSSGGTTADTSKTATPAANSLDVIYQNMVKSANAPAAGLGVDEWGYYLNAQLAPLGKSAPDPMPLFTAIFDAAKAVAAATGTQAQSFDRSMLVTAPAYWNVMAPALRAQLGLSGLGIYGGLGALVRRYR